MPKFAVGDKVIFCCGASTVKATVVKVTTTDGITEYKTPLYSISWPPTGKAIVYESQISPAGLTIDI